MTIRSILIANRGEIAVRIARTCRELGIRSIAVYPDADAAALHVARADDAVALGPDPRAYLDVAAIIGAAQRSGADAVHPGYGFLSENPALARACEAAGITFIGPSAAVIETMGSKISAKAVAVRAGVPVVPGRSEPGLTDAAIADAVAQIGLPVLLKASAGGGGKGMRVVADAAQLPDAIRGARREAAAAFGDDALMVERFVASPRHIEVQIIGDRHGHVVALADRECSLQRRHQKVIEEAPATSIGQDMRARMAADAINVATAVGYQGAGTVEFIVDGDEYYFLEMNTRLQVEHPVTELVTGHDLVALQIAVADGAPVAGLATRARGVAVEARIYAEDPASGFLPTGGRLLAVHLPSGVRVDTGVRAGDTVGSHYDPMLAKVIVHGPDRASAYRLLQRALRDTAMLGLTTNIGYLADLAAHESVLANAVHTRWIDEQAQAAQQPPVPDDVLIAAALDGWLPAADPVGWTDPWSVRSGWRMGPAAWAGWRFRAGGTTHDVELRGDLQARIDGGPARRVQARRDGATIVLSDASGTRLLRVAREGESVWLARDGRSWRLSGASRLAADRADEAGAALAPVRSPMPGTVIAVSVRPGEAVTAGQALVTVEAMKMEHTLRASADGTVAAVLVAAGDRVVLEQDLVQWEACDA